MGDGCNESSGGRDRGGGDSSDVATRIVKCW